MKCNSLQHASPLPHVPTYQRSVTI